MLENTFAHVPGIGVTTERALWQQGCGCWNDFLQAPDAYRYGTASPELMRTTIEQSVEALEQKNGSFFRRALGTNEAWRAFPEFRDSCAYVDIETDGGQSGESITTIGLFDGREFQVFVKGRNLADFEDVISEFRMIVTFFGNGFDIPMLSKRFRHLRWNQIHIDLCPTLRRLGLRGGLKRIEKELGIARGEDTDGLSGLDAIRLWRRYSMLRDEQALETLIAYNREDVVNLETLTEYAYTGLRKLVFESAKSPA